MTNDGIAFRKGASTFCHLRDLATSYRNDIIARANANEAAHLTPGGDPSSSTLTSGYSATSRPEPQEDETDISDGIPADDATRKLVNNAASVLEEGAAKSTDT